jgi:pyruvate dehydrogenase (quinone)
MGNRRNARKAGGESNLNHGDGGFLFSAMELETAVRLKSNIVHMIWIDGAYDMVVGIPTIWAARYLTMNGKRRLLGSFNHGSAANALPQAIGAQVAFPDRQVITFSGEGGLSMLMGEILSLKQLNLPVKIVVFNNSSFAFVEPEMKAAGIPDFATELHDPNFAGIAQAAGLCGVRVEYPEELSGGLKEAFSYDGPALLEVLTSRLELSMPPTIESSISPGRIYFR